MESTLTFTTEDRSAFIQQAKGLLDPALSPPWRRLFIVTGAGISIQAGDLPGWTGMLEKALDFVKTQYPDRRHELDRHRRALVRGGEHLDVASFIKEGSLKPEQMADFLKELFQKYRTSASNVKDPTLLYMLSQLSAAGARIATVNYDTLLEDATRMQSIDWTGSAALNNHFFNGESPETDRLVMHIHGRWDDPPSVIWSLKDYDHLLSTSATSVRLRQNLQQAFSRDTLLFLGCGDTMTDPHIKHLLALYSEYAPPGTTGVKHVYLCGDDNYEALHRSLPGTFQLVPYGTHKDLPDCLVSLFPFLSKHPGHDVIGSSRPLRSNVSAASIPLNRGLFMPDLKNKNGVAPYYQQYWHLGPKLEVMDYPDPNLSMSDFKEVNESFIFMIQSAVYSVQDYCKDPMVKDAAISAKVVVTRLLEPHGVLQDSAGRGLGHYLVFNRAHNLMQLLLQAGMGPELNTRDSDEATPLHYAVFLGDINMSRIILEHCPEAADMGDLNARTPFYWACKLFRESIIKLLAPHSKSTRSNTKSMNALLQRLKENPDAVIYLDTTYGNDPFFERYTASSTSESSEPR